MANFLKKVNASFILLKNTPAFLIKKLASNYEFFIKTITSY